MRSAIRFMHYLKELHFRQQELYTFAASRMQPQNIPCYFTSHKYNLLVSTGTQPNLKRA